MRPLLIGLCTLSVVAIVATTVFMVRLAPVDKDALDATALTHTQVINPSSVHVIESQRQPISSDEAGPVAIARNTTSAPTRERAAIDTTAAVTVSPTVSSWSDQTAVDTDAYLESMYQLVERAEVKFAHEAVNADWSAAMHARIAERIASDQIPADIVHYECRSVTCRIEYQMRNTPERDVDMLLDDVADALLESLPRWSMLTMPDSGVDATDGVRVLLIGSRS